LGAYRWPLEFFVHVVRRVADRRDVGELCLWRVVVDRERRALGVELLSGYPANLAGQVRSDLRGAGGDLTASRRAHGRREAARVAGAGETVPVGVGATGGLQRHVAVVRLEAARAAIHDRARACDAEDDNEA